MKKYFGFIALVIGLGGTTLPAADSTNADKLIRMLQVSTLTLLKEGNIRYTDGKSFHPNLESTRRAELAAAGQEPMATILACSDSREPVELIFDRGVGDLFVVRVAGNVAGLSELATIEYGVAHLGTPVLIVMGHSKCGAVTAAVKGGELHGHLPSLVSLIKPAADKARGSAPEDELVPRAIELNVWQQVENIFTKSAVVRESIAAGKVQIVGAVYDITSGKVQWLGPHPEWDRLVASAKSSSAPTEAHGAPAVAPPPIPAATPAHAETPTKPEAVKHASAQTVESAKSHPPAPSAKPVTRAEMATSHH